MDRIHIMFDQKINRDAIRKAWMLTGAVLNKKRKRKNGVWKGYSCLIRRGANHGVQSRQGHHQ